MKYTIAVTQEDIDKGKTCSAGDCPLALALQRVFGGNRALVRSNSWQEASGLPRRKLPPKAVEFISGFDQGNPVLPFEFEVELEIL